jgi:hypothetical protein
VHPSLKVAYYQATDNKFNADSAVLYCGDTVKVFICTGFVLPYRYRLPGILNLEKKISPSKMFGLQF